MFANEEEIYAAIQAVNALDVAPRFPGVYQLFTRDVGAIDSDRMRVGHDEVLAKTRTAKPGEDIVLDDETAFFADYDLEYVYQALRKPTRALAQDPTGLVADAVMRWLGRARAEMLDETVHDALVANAIAGPDGVPLFSTSHPIVGTGGTASNQTSDALSQSSFDAAMVAMHSQPLDNGQPSDISPTALFVAPGLLPTAKAIVDASDRVATVDGTGAIDPGASVVAAASVTQIWQGSVDLIVDKRLPAGGWFLASLNASGFWSLGHGNEGYRVVETKPESYSEFHRNMKQWKASEYLAHGPSQWRYVFGNIGS